MSPGGPLPRPRTVPWQAPVALADRLWLLGTYHYNLYLIQGRQGVALIEVGISAVADEVLRQLRMIGLAPDHLIVTHPHADHVTGLTALREAFPGAQVYLGRGAPEFLAHPKAVSALIGEDEFMSDVVRALDLPVGRPPVTAPPPLEGCRTVGEGDEVDLGGATLRFLEAGGHSPGHVAVHVPELRAVFPSDALGFRSPGRWVAPLFFSGYREYMETLVRLEALSAQLVGLGHQGAVAGVAAEEAFTAARRVAVDFFEEVRAWKGAPEELAERKFQAGYRDELRINSEANVRNCMSLLVRRSLEALAAAG